jgi:hypothetical protein
MVQTVEPWSYTISCLVRGFCDSAKETHSTSFRFYPEPDLAIWLIPVGDSQPILLKQRRKRWITTLSMVMPRLAGSPMLLRYLETTTSGIGAMGHLSSFRLKMTIKPDEVAASNNA